MIVFYNNKIVDLSEVIISPFDRGFQFSDGVYEVIRYYPQKFFRYDAHLERLKYSLREMEIPKPNLDGLENILYELIRRNNLISEPAIAYLQITRGVQLPRRHLAGENIIPTIFIYVEKFPTKMNEMANGVKVSLEEDIRWHRCDIKTIALIPNILSKRKSAEKGLFETIWHRNGIITEGTQTNVFFVKDNSVFTHPLDKNILAGITRAAVFEICKQLSVPYYEKEIKISELKNFDEAFLASTTSEVMPIIEIDGLIVGSGTPGNITKLLQREYRQMYL